MSLRCSLRRQPLGRGRVSESPRAAAEVYDHRLDYGGLPAQEELLAQRLGRLKLGAKGLAKVLKEV